MTPADDLLPVMRLPIPVVLLLPFSFASCVDAAPRAVVAVPGVRAKLLSAHDGHAEVQLVLDPHAEVVAVLKEFVRQNPWRSVHFVGLGACTDATIGYYDPDTKAYRRTTLTQQMEIVSLVGDAAQGSKEEGFHAHIGLGFADGTMHGGHLFEAHVSPTLEILVQGSPEPLVRRHDEAFNAELLVP